MQKSLALTLALASLVACKSNQKTADSEMTSDTQAIRKTSSMVDMQEQICCIAMETVHGTWGGKVPAHYETDSFFVTGEFLYWQANEEGLEYAVKVEGFSINNILLGQAPDPTGPDIPSTTQTLEKLRFEWNPGFRVGIGTQMGCHDDWDIYLNYTRIKNKAHGSVGPIDQETNAIFAQWAPMISGVFSPSASAKWHVKYNTLDLELGKDYFVGTHLALRPHLGLRGAVIDQKYNAKYALFNIPSGTTITLPSGISENSMDAKNDFSGIGLRAGSDLMWHFTENFGLYGELSASLLYGKFKVKETFEGIINSASGSTAFLVTSNVAKENFHQTVGNIQGAIGLEWEEIFSSGDYRIAISASYEIAEWFHQNQLMSSIFSSLATGGGGGGGGASVVVGEYLNHQRGNLGFQGGTFRIALDF